MFDCLILGDSIAYGVGKEIKECRTYAEVGISTKKYDEKYLKEEKRTDIAIISLGSNNPGKNLSKDLKKVKDKIKTVKRIWILPHDPKIRDIVKSVALSFGDDFVDFEVSKDNIHPKNYFDLSHKIKSKF